MKAVCVLVLVALGFLVSSVVRQFDFRYQNTKPVVRNNEYVDSKYKAGYADGFVRGVEWARETPTQPVNIAYSNELKTICYGRNIGYLYAPGNTNDIIGFKTESTNVPAAIIHVVTYGVGDKAIFRLWASETLPEPGGNWQNTEGRVFNNSAWVTGP